jgi:phosphoglycolate phosphatase
MPEKKPIIFIDFDGVIMDSLEAVLHSFLTIGPKYGVDWIKSKDDVGALLHENFFVSCAEHGIDETALDGMFTEMNQRIHNNDVTVDPFPSMIPVLERTSKKANYIIVSSNQSVTINHHLARHNLSIHFDQIIGADISRSKAEAIKAFLMKDNLDPSQTLFIGDTRADILEGKLAGVKTVAVLWGYHSEKKLADENPDYIVHNAEELESLISARLAQDV